MKLKIVNSADGKKKYSSSENIGFQINMRRTCDGNILMINDEILFT